MFWLACSVWMRGVPPRERQPSNSLVNSAPEGEGWFFKLRLSDNHQLSDLMSAEEYKAFVDSQ